MDRVTIFAISILFSSLAIADETGLYIGGHLGYSSANSEVTLGDATDTATFNGVGSDGIVGGGLIGYTFFESGKWDFSVEFDASIADVETELSLSGTTFGNASATASLDATYSFLAKLGYDIADKTDVFIKVGGVIGDFGVDYNEPSVATFSASENQTGFLLGLGTDIEVTERMKLIGEYQYQGYEDFSASQSGVTTSLDPDVHIFRAGFLYSF